MAEINTTIPPNERGPQVEYTPEQHKEGFPDFSRAVVALVLIGVGGILLASNFNLIPVGLFEMDNWWALFMLIPIFSLTSGIIYDVTRNGRLTSHGRSKIFGLIMMTVLFSAFFFGWNWGRIWPVFIIMGGLSMMFKQHGGRHHWGNW